MNRYKYFLLWFFISWLTLSSYGQNKELRIGYILEPGAQKDNFLFQSISQEVEQILKIEYQVPLEENQIYFAGLRNDQILSGLSQFLNDPEIDIIVGIGPLVSDVLARQGPYDKPVIASLIIDNELQNIEVSEKGTSNIGNFNFILSPYSAGRDLNLYYSIYPFQYLAVFIDENIFNGFDGLSLHFERQFQSQGVRYKLIPINNNVEEALKELSPDMDAVYLGPIFSLDEKAVQILIDHINQLKLPSFALAGTDVCRKGVMASASPSSNSVRIGRRVALNIQKILDDVDIRDIPVALKYREALHINMETLRKIEFYPTWDILSQAVLLNEEETNIDRTVNLLSVIQEALNQNLELQIEEKVVRSGQQDVTVAKSVYYPQAYLSHLTSVIDKNRAESSFGSAPQYASTLSGSVDFLIFSEEANANRDIQASLQDARIHAKTTLEMDIVKETAEAYLNILRALTLVRIQRENLSLNRRNLDLATIRNEVGYSGPSDLYRWRSSIALAKKSVNEAERDLEQAKMQLNQILQRPISEKFLTEEVSLVDNYIITNDNRLNKYINAPDVFEKFSDFMVEEGMQNLPEIDQIEAGIEVQRRSLLFQRKNRYLPQIGLQAGMDEVYYRGGAGKSSPDFGIPGVGGELNNLTWSIGVNASLPLFTGNKRKLLTHKAQIDLEHSLIKKDHFIRQFEQRIRNELEETSASYVNIDLSFDAREAARKNLSLVQDAYSKGLVSVIQLIDAQNAAIQSEEGAANAIYKFVLDLIQLERAIGNFYSLSDENQRNAYFQRLEAYITNH